MIASNKDKSFLSPVFIGKLLLVFMSEIEKKWNLDFTLKTE